ncbi:MAG: molybdate ABC transporter substrate-binding protein [Hyphomicrobiales bacterium]
MRHLVLAALFCVSGITMSQAETVQLFAAGSLKRALGDVAEAYGKASGNTVETTFGASGLMRQKIEEGATAHVFASANMEHPKALEEAGRAGPVTLFARNRLCALAQPLVQVESGSLIYVLLDPKVRVGTSTPKADPSGDYAWELFARAEKLSKGARKILEEKALKLTGGPDTEKAPEGRNQYAWVMEEKKADVFLTYCTNAVLARKELSGLKIIQIPKNLSVGADYGLTVLKDAPEAARKLSDFILSPAGQKILKGYGFETVKAR